LKIEHSFFIFCRLNLKIALAITVSYLVIGCSLKKSENPLDPANICGGISSAAVGVRLSGIDYRNSILQADGVHFDLYSSIQNCLGKEIPSSTTSVDSASGLTINSPNSPTVGLLTRDSISSVLNFGSFIYDPNVNSSSISLNFATPTETKQLSSNLGISSLQPAFVVDTANYQIVDGAGTSNGDLLVDPGERITFNLKVSNLSVTTIKSLTTNINSSNAYIVIASGNASSFGDLTSKASGTSGTTTTINIDPNTPRGTSTNLTITLTDQFAHTWTKTINILVSPTVPPPRKSQVLSLASNMTFKGFTADASYWYVMITENIGNGVNYWRFYRKSASATTFSHVCSVLDDGNLKAHLAVDSNYFYIGQNGNIRRLNKTTCASVDTITPSNGVNGNSTALSANYYSSFTLSIDSGLMYYAQTSSSLSSYNLGSTAITSQTTNQTLGSKTLAQNYAQYIVFGGTRWVHDRNNDLIWKLDSSNTALAWGTLPTSIYSDLNYVKAVATQNGSTLLLATEKNTGTVNIMSIDASGLSNTPTQELSTNSNQEIISLGPLVFSGCGTGRDATSSPGCQSITDINTMSLASNMTFEGFAVDSSNWYVMVSENIGNGVNYWRFYQKSTSATSFTHVCSKLDDGNLKAHLAVDSNYFYIGQNGNIRRLNKTTCASVDTITPSNGVNGNSTALSANYYSPFTLSIDSGLMYYAQTSSSLSSYNLGSTAITSQTTNQALGSKTLAQNYAQYIVFGGTRWVHDRNNDLIWKLDSSNTALAWGALPISTYSDLNYVKAIATQNGTTLTLATEQTIGVVKFYSIDVSHFQDSAGQTGTQSVSTQSLTLPIVFAGCSAGQLASSSQQCFTLTSVTTLNISAGSTFSGFSTDATYLYLVTKNASNAWSAYKKLPADSSWSGICGITDASLAAHLAVDSNYFYIGQSGSIRRLNKTTCSSVDTLTPSNGVNGNSTALSANYYSPFTLSVDSGLMYYAQTSSSLSSYNLSSTTATSQETNQTLGTKTLAQNYAQYTVFGGTRWAHDRNNNLIWKLDSSNTALTWGALPTSTYSDLNYVKAIATQNGTTLIFATEQTTGVVKFYFFDLTNF
jgi:hypothetical protein